MIRFDTMYTLTRTVFIVLYFCFNTTEALSGWEEYEAVYGNPHHHGPRILCLGNRPNLETPQLNHFFSCHIEPSITTLDLRCQPCLNDNHLGCLGNLPQASTIIDLNLSKTGITYDGISALWKSPFLGCNREDRPIFEDYYNLPVSVVRVEIGHTPAYDSYVDLFRATGNRIFPLPLRNNFEITYTNPVTQRWQKTIGFKSIVLTNHGVPINSGYSI